MSGEIRITGPVLKVLGAFMHTGSVEVSGADIIRVTNLASGTLYPILFRLERSGWVESRWEEVDPSVVLRPRRRFYRITALGEVSLKATVSDLRPTFGRLAWV